MLNGRDLPASASPHDESISLPERWRQAIARLRQPEPAVAPPRPAAAAPEDFADTEPGCFGR
jgi:hypothetical protein